MPIPVQVEVYSAPYHPFGHLEGAKWSGDIDYIVWSSRRMTC